MGLGRFGGGVDSAKFAAANGGVVIVTDMLDENELADSIDQLKEYPQIEYHLGQHFNEDFENADIVIVNPAVPNSNKYLRIAKENNAVVTSQMELFFEYCPAMIVGITGSNGKSTTTSLTIHILKNANLQRNVWLSGNIGNEPLLMLLERIEPDDIVVLELSSFQIEQLALENKAPDIALITNLLPNHLDRYGTFEKYCASKEHLFTNQKLYANEPAFSIFNYEDEITAQWFEKYKNDKGRRCLTYECADVPENIKSKYKLPGEFNVSNLAAAMSIAKLFDVSDEIIENCIADFRALPHRLELVADINNVKWYNDSKATTPESTIAAINAFDEPVILIAGGYDKKLPFDELGKVISQKCKTVFLIGQTAEKIKSSINKSNVTICSDLEQVVKKAYQTAIDSDVVLLSPACASYDMFENYQQRGDTFTQLVKQILN
jgi:UDP-N-acetylmuramoylalanine--D-glutamate ligase